MVWCVSVKGSPQVKGRNREVMDVLVLTCQSEGAHFGKKRLLLIKWKLTALE